MHTSEETKQTEYEHPPNILKNKMQKHWDTCFLSGLDPHYQRPSLDWFRSQSQLCADARKKVCRLVFRTGTSLENETVVWKIHFRTGSGLVRAKVCIMETQNTALLRISAHGRIFFGGTREAPLK